MEVASAGLRRESLSEVERVAGGSLAEIGARRLGALHARVEPLDVVEPFTRVADVSVRVCHREEPGSCPVWRRQPVARALRADRLSFARGAMGTVTATALAVGIDLPAIGVALREASRKLGRPPTYGFLFASPGADLRAALAAAREIAGGAPILGCTTAGEITGDGLSHGSVAVMLVADEATTLTAFATGLKRDPAGAAGILAQGLRAAKTEAMSNERRHLTSVLLTDGLTGTAERLVETLYDARVQSSSQIVGGAAGDEGAFRATTVGSADGCATDSAAVLHVFGKTRWGVGIGHGLEPTTKQMRVTKAHDNIVVEIDGEPAFAAYEKHAAARGITLTRADASRYLIANELGIHFFETVSRARAPLSVEPDGSLVCAAEVPKGSMVSILDGEPKKMVDAARAAATTARAQLEGAPAAGVLLFDCVCRGMILRESFYREIDAIRSVFGDVPIAGFLTYGEIARHPGRLDGWHNATAVVVAIPA
jgi:hypothetical protein